MKSPIEWLMTLRRHLIEESRRLDEGRAKLHKGHDPAECIEARLGQAWLKKGGREMAWKAGDQACIKGTGEKVWVRESLPDGRYRVQEVADASNAATPADERPTYSRRILPADQLEPCEPYD
jgi:hypothetical protein